MPRRYDAAVAELYQAPHGDFVRERKRLADELKAGGDKPGATTLAKLPRPTISAWAVNQLWWHARDAFDALFDTAAKLRKGDLRATGPYREATAKLRARAAVMLADAGHAATEATLRKVTSTLAALAANDGWEPDAPGTLAEDRDPPGFTAVGIGGPAEEPAGEVEPATAHAPDTHAKPTHDDDHAQRTQRDAAEAKRREEAEAKRAAAEAAAERKRAEQAAAKRAAEQRQLEDALRTAQHEVDRKTRDLERLRAAVAHAEGAVDKSQAVVDELAAKLAELVRASEEAS